MNYSSWRRLTFGLLVLSTWSCNETEKAIEPGEPYYSGVLVLNAGNFLDNNGTVSFLSRNSAAANFDIFNAVNRRSLTGGVQHYTEVNGKGLILVDNSTAGQDKVEIVNAGTFTSLATLKSPDIENPRYAVRVSDTKAYVSCWDVSGDYTNGTFYKDPGYIAVVDLTTQTVVKKIPALKGPETMVVSGNDVFVGSVGGGQAVAVIDLTTDTPRASVEIGTNPNLIGLDANGKLWVATGAELVRINPQSKTVEGRLTIPPKGGRSGGLFRLSQDKRSILFVYSFSDAADNYKAKGETYRFSVTEGTIQTATPFINRYFSGLDVDPVSGLIYAGYSPSLKQSGYIYRFQPNGTLIDSVKAEINPSGFYFK